MFGEAFPAGAVTLLDLRCHAHALLLTIAKVNIVSTSLKVTLRKLVMTQVFCGTHCATIANWWQWHDRTAMFGRHANTWLIIAKTDHQNWLPIIPDNSRDGKLSGIIGKNRNPDNYQFFPTRQSLRIIPNFSREACQTMESHLVESCSIFEVFPQNAKFPTFCGVSLMGLCIDINGWTWFPRLLSLCCCFLHCAIGPINPICHWQHLSKMLMWYLLSNGPMTLLRHPWMANSTCPSPHFLL
jgi:hypothetical protein